MSELILACPFCSGEAVTRRMGYDYWRIYCSDLKFCGVNSPQAFSTQQEAIKAWNKRAKDDGMSTDEIKQIIKTWMFGYQVSEEIANRESEYLVAKLSGHVKGIDKEPK